MAGALGGCGYDWGHFAEADTGSAPSPDLAAAIDLTVAPTPDLTPAVMDLAGRDMSGEGRYEVRGTFAGGRALSSGGGYEVRGQLVWRAARQGGGNYTIEGGLR